MNNQADKMNAYIHKLKIILTAQGMEVGDNDLRIFEHVYQEGYQNGQRDLLKNHLKNQQ